MADRIKTVSQYDGSNWINETPIGADASNIDVVTAGSTSRNLQDVLGTPPASGNIMNDISSKVSTSGGDVAETVVSKDIDNYDSSTTAGDDILTDTAATINTSISTLWSRFNFFRKKVSNNFNNYFANSNLVGTDPGVTSTGNNSTVYTTGAINNYLNNVIGYTSASTPSAGKVSSQLSTLNSSAIKNITHSGDTNTVTRMNNTTFTFKSGTLINAGYHSNTSTNVSVGASSSKTQTVISNLGSQSGDIIVLCNVYISAATSGGTTWAYCSLQGIS